MANDDEMRALFLNMFDEEFGKVLSGRINEMFEVLIYKVIRFNKCYEHLLKRVERITVLFELDENEGKTPTEICEKLKRYPFSRVSRALVDLAKAGIARCVNDSGEVNRKYVLTKEGAMLKRIIQKEKEEIEETTADEIIEEED